LDRTFDPQKLQNQLQLLAGKRFIESRFVAVPNKSMRLVLQGVGTRFEQFMTVPGKESRSKRGWFSLVLAPAPKLRHN